MKYASLPEDVQQSNKDLIDALKGHTKDIVPFVGAGVSKGCGLPDWRGLLQKLSERFLDGKKPGRNLFSFANDIFLANKKRKGKELGVNQTIARIVSAPDIERCSYLNTIITQFSEEIITTNYDLCLESSALKYGISNIESVYSLSDERLAGFVLDKVPRIVHLHGSVQVPRTIVLSKESYDRIYGVNDNGGKAVSFLNSRDDRILLFIGCSLQKDRTLDVLSNSFDREGKVARYAILEYPNDKKKYAAINSRMTKIGAQAIYYSKKHYEEIGMILNEICGGKEKYSIHNDKVIKEDSKLTFEDFFASYQKKYIDSFCDPTGDTEDRILAEELVNRFLKKRNNTGVALEELYREICVEANSDNRSILIKGLQGTGKSTLLSLLYGKLLETRDSENGLYPIIIDFHSKDESTIIEDVKVIANYIEMNPHRYVMLVDGIDECSDDEVYMQEGYKRVIEFLSKHQNILRVLCVTQVTKEEKKHLYDSSHGFHVLYDDTSKVYGMHRVKIRKDSGKGISEVLSQIALCFKKNHIEIQSDEIVSLLMHYSIRKVDFRTLLILSKTIAQDSEKNSLGTCIERYYTNRLNKKGITEKKDIKEILSNRATHEFELMCTRNGCVTKGRLCRTTVSRNSITRAFFVAYHLVDQLKNLITSGIESLDERTIVLSAVTNELFYDIFEDLDPDDKDSIIEALTALTEKGSEDERMKRIKRQPCLFAQVCYFMGILSRASLVGLSRKESLTRKIRETLQDIWEDLEKYLFSENCDGSSLPEYKTTTYYGLLFLFRTISIARILCHDNGHEDDFLRYVLLNNDLNMINRGFHVAYYAEKVEKEEAYYLDTEKDNIDTVNVVLFDSLKDSKNPLKNLNALTIISFFQNNGAKRVDRETVSTYLADVKKLISQIVKKRSSYSKVVIDYAQTVAVDVDNNTPSPYRVAINSIYGLKANDMKGWNCKNRKVDNAESISDHIYGSYLLGLVFLPESIKGTKYETDTSYSDYSKHLILEEILIHDFGKFKNGDEATGQQEKDYLKKQKDAVRQFQYLRTYTKIYFPDTAYKTWDDYHNAKDINATLANEITSIEMLVTALMYKQNKDNVIDATEWIDWANDKETVRSDMGKEILTTVLSAFTSEELGDSSDQVE